jgi:hypothetical protein
MMKKLFLLINLSFITLVLFSQDLPKLVLTDKGFEPVVYQVDSLNASTIYKRTMDWVQITYENPKEVLKANVENEIIRLVGLNKGVFFRTFKSGKKVSYDISYTLEINIKEGKYRFIFIPNQITVNSSKVLFGIPDFFTGKLDVNGNSYEGCAASLESSINTFSLSLYNYILGKKEDDKW